MTMPAEITLRDRAIVSLLGGIEPGVTIEHVHSLGPARVPVPPLPTGGHVFDLWPVRELPDQGVWAAPHYDSFAPPLFVLYDVLLHSCAGILAAGGFVLRESLTGTNPRDHAYRALAKGIALQPATVTELAGTHITLLGAGSVDYGNAMLHGLARLTQVPDTYLLAAESILVPAGSARQREAIALLDLPPSLAVRTIGQTETWRIEKLIFPLSVCGEAAYHPCLTEFFRRLSSNVPRNAARLPRRFYLETPGGPRNAAELKHALARLGFVPVQPGRLSLADQIRLFREAEAVVAPHGSALTNLGFCRPGCLVVELLMDACVNWSFRNLSALCQLRYDCVIGRARHPWGDLNEPTDRVLWDISVNHVVAALAHALDEREAADLPQAEAA
jgi:hypothetical protein